VNHTFAMVIESLVALLLLLTILYCVALNRQLKSLKADEAALKAMVAELVAATAVAERAIGGLKSTVSDCEQGIGQRLRDAERVNAEMERQVAASKQLVERLARIVSAGQAALPPHDAAVATDTKAIVAAAQAFAERTRARVRGAAA